MTQEVKLAIVGSRTFGDQKTCWTIINFIKNSFDYAFTGFVSGGARGADTFGQRYAEYYKIPVQIFYPDWNKHGRAAGYIRNMDIIENCDICIAFWDGISRGTQHDFKLCAEKSKKCYVYNFTEGSLYIDGPEKQYIELPNKL